MYIEESSILIKDHRFWLTLVHLLEWFLLLGSIWVVSRGQEEMQRRLSASRRGSSEDPGNALRLADLPRVPLRIFE